MKKIISLAALAVLSAGASASSSVADNLLVDGSFESISQGTGWGTYNTVPGWTVTTASGAHSPNGLEVRNGIAGAAEDGNNFIELDGYENDKISQTFATTTNKSYEISFWYADRPDVTSAFLQGTRAVQGSGGFQYSVTGAGSSTYLGSFGTSWHEAVIEFVAAGPSTTFSIWAKGKSDGFGTSFDDFNVSVVPEPGTLGLFAAGLAVLGLSRRRQK